MSKSRCSVYNNFFNAKIISNCSQKELSSNFLAGLYAPEIRLLAKQSVTVPASTFFLPNFGFSPLQVDLSANKMYEVFPHILNFQ